MTQTSLFDLEPIAKQKLDKQGSAKMSEAAQTGPGQDPTGKALRKSKAKAKPTSAPKAEIADVSDEAAAAPSPKDGDAQGPGADAIVLKQFLCFSLYSATHAMNRVYKPFLNDLGLTYPQYLAMSVLWQKDKILVGELGDRLHLESNTMTPLLKRLEVMGLLTRTRDKKDERQVRIALTRQGRALKSKTGSLGACILAATGMSAHEVIELQGKITKLRNNLLQSSTPEGAQGQAPDFA